ncbi:hypothetical protein CHS0354_014512 [Potamilus streckersoni]|uniref:Zinc-finger domain-containing protein n=1 Tax=Potamilus streckersoni TaxID=2493646 RepID=A0AAE0S9Q4_9BIVA|nr:hypothetical protein CHS0354_014512 [Potamilus streckersoni]
MSNKQKTSLYEELRQKNIADNKVILEKLMSEIKDHLPNKIVPPRKPKESKKKFADDLEVRRNPSRSARFNPEANSPPRTRGRRGSVSSSISSSSSSSPDNKLVVRFGFFGKRSIAPDDDSYEDDRDEEDLLLPKRVHRVDREIKAADEITEEDLKLVAMFVSDKKYDSIYGTTCHQCRQKTDDMKTICRSGNCFGVRGQFCGPCLRNRYGEDAKEVLKNPNWICPPCRGVCNCSFCRKRKGKTCTGILIHIAREHGFADVNSYLQSLRN